MFLYPQSDENEDDNGDSQNGDHEDCAGNNKVDMQCPEKTRKYLFDLTLVNSYGSNDIQALNDNNKALKLTGTYCSRTVMLDVGC